MNPVGIYRKPANFDHLVQAMDYSYFAAMPQQQQQHHQFLALPPTPGHSNTANSDDFSNGSPPDPYDFQVFDAYNHYNGSGVPEPPTPQSTHKAVAPVPNEPVDDGSEANGDQNRQGSNSDDEDMTPALARRKAQNRAAQRAFRERKERHVKELEAQVAALKQSVGSVAAENERLKLNLQKVSVENEILRATAQAHPNQSSTSHTLPDTGPMHYNPKDFYNEVLDGHPNNGPSHRITTDPDTGGKLLAVGATWDFIINHPSFKNGLVDVASVSELLKPQAKCDGQGPVFEERAILAAIEKSVASGSDELI